MTLNFRGVNSIHINPSEFGEFVMKSALFEGIKLDTQIGGFMSCNKKKYVYIHICIQIFVRSLAKKTGALLRILFVCHVFVVVSFSQQRAETPKVTMTLIDNANQADGAKWSRVSCFNEGWS